MALRLNRQLIAGELDNTVPGKVTGWMEFAGLDGRSIFDLNGNFHRDIRGTKIILSGEGHSKCMDQFGLRQTGEVGDITAGLPPRDYVDYPYIEWYSDANGRVVLELDSSQVEVIGQPIPAIESDPIDRGAQMKHMSDFMNDMSQKLNDSQEQS